MNKDLIKDEIYFTKNRINLLNKKIEENKEIGFVTIVGYDKDGIWSENRTIEEVKEMIKELELRLEELKVYN